MHELRLTIIT
jgi:hypothetical protein